MKKINKVAVAVLFSMFSILSVFSIVSLLSSSASATDNADICYKDDECNKLVGNIYDVTYAQNKEVKILYQLYSRLRYMALKKSKSMTSSEKKTVYTKLTKLYNKIYETDNWVKILEFDANVAINNYDKNELGDVYNAIYDPWEEIETAYEMINELMELLELK
ncbi:MAG: hypothetical protein ABIG89_02250 [Candidatus Woesearchaeota archaeon]